MKKRHTPLLAADRVRLYLTLVPYLLEHGQVTLDEAAAEFGVTADEMRDMVQKLTVIGLPGEAGFWQQPQELFDINWDLLDQESIIEITNDVALRHVPRFTAREAAALLAGLQMVAAVPEVADSGLVAGLLSKLARGAASAPADVVVAPGEIDEAQQIVSRAIRNQVAVSFSYQAPDAAVTIRTVDPVQVLITNAQWYLQGWCHLRRAMRTFHLDRVSNLTLTDTPTTHQTTAFSEDFADLAETSDVTVQLPERLASLLGAYLAADNHDVVGGILMARMNLADPRGFRRVAARFGGALQVVAPEFVRAATREWAEAGLALYHQPRLSSGE